MGVKGSGGGESRGSVESETVSTSIGWDHFKLINCYRNIYPDCDLSNSYDVFMWSESVHQTQSGQGGGLGTEVSGVGVGGDEMVEVEEWRGCQ